MCSGASRVIRGMNVCALCVSIKFFKRKGSGVLMIEFSLDDEWH